MTAQPSCASATALRPEPHPMSRTGLFPVASAIREPNRRTRREGCNHLVDRLTSVARLIAARECGRYAAVRRIEKDRHTRQPHCTSRTPARTCSSNLKLICEQISTMTAEAGRAANYRETRSCRERSGSRPLLPIHPDNPLGRSRAPAGCEACSRSVPIPSTRYARQTESCGRYTQRGAADGESIGGGAPRESQPVAGNAPTNVSPGLSDRTPAWPAPHSHASWGRQSRAEFPAPGGDGQRPQGGG